MKKNLKKKYAYNYAKQITNNKNNTNIFLLFWSLDISFIYKYFF